LFNSILPAQMTRKIPAWSNYLVVTGEIPLLFMSYTELVAVFYIMKQEGRKSMLLIIN
jgi:hypothetical protein